MSEQKNDDSRFRRIAEKIASLKEVLARGGSIVASWRRRDGRRYGPYYRLAYRLDGRQQSIYLGGSVELVEKIRGLLGQLQEPLRLQRQLQQVRRAVTAAFRQVQADFKRVMQSRGFYTRGTLKVRGWRQYKAALWMGRPFPEVELRSCPTTERENWQNGRGVDQREAGMKQGLGIRVFR